MRLKCLRLMISFLLVCVTVVSAAEPARRVDVGDDIPSYASTKCGGIEDGVAVGKTLCYTCRAGDEPIFYVFAKKPSEPLAKLVKEIDAVVAARQADKAAAVVNFLGDPKDEAVRQNVGEFGRQHGLKNVSLTITADGSKFELDDADDITVLLFEKGIIRLRSSAKVASFDDKAIATVVRRSKAVLK